MIHASSSACLSAFYSSNIRQLLVLASRRSTRPGTLRANPRRPCRRKSNGLLRLRTLPVTHRGGGCSASTSSCDSARCTHSDARKPFRIMRLLHSSLYTGGGGCSASTPNCDRHFAHTATPANPFVSCVYFTVRCIPGVGVSDDQISSFRGSNLELRPASPNPRPALLPQPCAPILSS